MRLKHESSRWPLDTMVLRCHGHVACASVHTAENLDNVSCICCQCAGSFPSIRTQYFLGYCIILLNVSPPIGYLLLYLTVYANAVKIKDPI